MIADPKRKPHQDDGDSDKRRRQEEALDEALKNTFPASDPVSVEQPITSGRAKASHLRVSSRLRACATSTASLQGASAISRISLAWKLVIVDNGSTDATPDIIECFKRRLPLEARGTGSGQESR
jgi:hypothetical protein